MADKTVLDFKPNLGITVIRDDTGKQLGTAEGDIRDNPWAKRVSTLSQVNMQGVPTQQDFNGATAQNKILGMGKDLAVNAASAVPLAFGPEGMPIRMALASLLAGGGTDKLLNPQKSSSDIVGDAMFNTGTGLVAPALIEALSGGLGKFRIPGMKSIRTAEPTITENFSRGTSSGSSVGETSGNTSTEGSGTSQSSGRTKGSSSTAGSGTTEGTSSTSGETSGNTSKQGKSVSDSTTQTGVDITGPHTPAMEAIGNEVKRLQKIDLTKYNVGDRKQVMDAIDKNLSALDALNEANTHSGNVRHTVTTTEGTGESSGTSKSNSSRSGKSANVSNTSNISDNSSSSTNTNKSDSTHSGTNTSQNSGTTERTGGSITKPGAVTTETTGHSLLERALEGIMDMHKNSTKQLTDLQKFLYMQLLPGAKAGIDNVNK